MRETGLEGIDRPRLWDLQEGSPCPFTENEQRFESWPALRDNANTFDDDLNIVIWWAWFPPDPTSRDGDGDTLFLYVALPNKEKVFPWSAKVSREEEPEIYAWLQRRLTTLMGWWQIPPAQASG